MQTLHKSCKTRLRSAAKHLIHTAEKPPADGPDKHGRRTSRRECFGPRPSSSASPVSALRLYVAPH